MNYYERNAIERINEITDNSELRRHLLSVEILIKELVGDDPYLFYSSRAQNYEKFERVESLIELRLLILNKIFGATDRCMHARVCYTGIHSGMLIILGMMTMR